jgi:hypothetical protein
VQESVQDSSSVAGSFPAAHATDSASAVKHFTRIRLQNDSVVKATTNINGDSANYQSDTLHFPSVSETGQNNVNIWGSHELQPTHDLPQQLKISNPDWLFIVLVLVLGVLTYIRVYYRKNFFQIIAACFNNNLTNQIVRDENLLMQRASVMLNVSFSIVAAGFIYLLSIHYDWALDGMDTGFIRFIFFTLVVSAVFTLKFLVLRFCGYLFNLGREMSTYIFNVFIINNLLGMFLIPVVALILFGNIPGNSTLHFIALGLASVAYLYRIGRGILIAVSYPGFSPFYLFLYLCALEIAPLLVLVKLVSMQ